MKSNWVANDGSEEAPVSPRVIGRNHDGLPVLQWSPQVQTTLLAMWGGNARLVVCHWPTVYQHEDGTAGDGWSDGWCYQDLGRALVALAVWNPLLEAEPQGWIKHIGTQRYRLHGDAAYEYRTPEERAEAHRRWDRRWEQLHQEAAATGS